MNPANNHSFKKIIFVLSVVVLMATTLIGCIQSDKEKGAKHFEQTLDALGGKEALLNLKSFQISTTGSSYATHMGLLPNDVKKTSTYSKKYTVEIKSWSIRTDANRQFTYVPEHGFPEQRYRVVTVDGIGAVSNGAHPLGLPGGVLSSQAVASMEKSMKLMNPQLLLKEVLEGKRDIQFGGTTTYEEQAFNILIVSDDVAPIKLYIHAESGTISMLETIENNMILRDVALVVTYKNWEIAKTLAFPMEVEITVAGNRLHHQLKTEVIEDLTIEEDFFALPKTNTTPKYDKEAYLTGLNTHHIHDEFFEIAGLYYIEEVSLTPTRLAQGIYQVRDNSANHLGGMIVEQENGVVVIEAHTSKAVSDELIKIVEELFPNKTITHLIQSHHHVDHASGVRTVISQGADLVVGNGVGSWWKDVLKAKSTIRPDGMSKFTEQPVVLEIESKGKMTISDSKIEITAYHILENPHALDMVITKVETENEIFLYEADLYNAGFGFTMAFGGPQSLFKAMRRLELIDDNCASPKPLTIIPGHGHPMKLNDAIVELNKVDIDVGCANDINK